MGQGCGGTSRVWGRWEPLGRADRGSAEDRSAPAVSPATWRTERLLGPSPGKSGKSPQQSVVSTTASNPCRTPGPQAGRRTPIFFLRALPPTPLCLSPSLLTSPSPGSPDCLSRAPKLGSALPCPRLPSPRCASVQKRAHAASLSPGGSNVPAAQQTGQFLLLWAGTLKANGRQQQKVVQAPSQSPHFAEH